MEDWADILITLTHDALAAHASIFNVAEEGQ
jgi:hypothetical protein